MLMNYWILWAPSTEWKTSKLKNWTPKLKTKRRWMINSLLKWANLYHRQTKEKKTCFKSLFFFWTRRKRKSEVWRKRKRCSLRILMGNIRESIRWPKMNKRKQLMWLKIALFLTLKCLELELLMICIQNQFFSQQELSTLRQTFWSL